MVAQHSGSGISSVRANCQNLLTMSYIQGNAGAKATVGCKGSELLRRRRRYVSNLYGCTLSLLREAEASFTIYDSSEVRSMDLYIVDTVVCLSSRWRLNLSLKRCTQVPLTRINKAQRHSWMHIQSLRIPTLPHSRTNSPKVVWQLGQPFLDRKNCCLDSKF